MRNAEDTAKGWAAALAVVRADAATTGARRSQREVPVAVPCPKFRRSTRRCCTRRRANTCSRTSCVGLRRNHSNRQFPSAIHRTPGKVITMNEIRRAGLEQLAMTIEAAMSQLTVLLDAERADVQDIAGQHRGKRLRRARAEAPDVRACPSPRPSCRSGRTYQCRHCERQRMNVQASTPQLLGCCDVALATYVWPAVRLVASKSRFRWSDPALRLLGAHWATQVSQHRISTAQGSALESRRFCDCLRGALRSGSLRGCFRSAMGHKRTGARGPLFSKTCGEQQ